MRSPIAAAFGLVLSLAPAGVAHAFCRTTTVHEPIPYDPVARGCWTQGVPMAWSGGQQIPYLIVSSGSHARGIPLSDAVQIAIRAFSAWNDASCNGQRPSVQAYYGGAISPDAAASDCGLHPCGAGVDDAVHVIQFDDDRWPYDDPNSTLALTTVTYGVDSGDIFDADIEINTKQQPITAQEPPPVGMYDLQSILTHEAGHFFGLAHATSTKPIMYARYQPGAIRLTQDDLDGMCTIYPPLPPNGCACGPAPAQSGALAFGGALSLAGVLALRTRRRRSG